MMMYRVLIALVTSLALIPRATAGTSRSASAAVQAFEDGRMGLALALARDYLQSNATQDSNSQTARLVEAFALLHLGRAEESAASLQALAGSGPDLGPYLDHLRARVASAVSDCNTAVASASRVSADSVFTAETWSKAIECLVRAHHFSAAAQALTGMENAVSRTTLQNDADSAQVLWWHARLSELARDYTEARDTYREILVDYPVTSAARMASERLANLRRQGVAVPPLDGEELLPKADSLRSPQHARRLYTRVKVRSRHLHRPDLAELAELGLAQRDVIEQRYARALSRVLPVAERGSQPSTRAQALFLRGDLLSRLNRYDAAQAAYQRAMVTLPDQPFTFLAALAAAQLAYRTGDVDAARADCAWLLAKPDADIALSYVRDDGARGEVDSMQALRDGALWLMAWIEYHAHSPASVIDSYLAPISVDGEFHEAALYWRARLAIDEGDHEAAAIFVDLLARSAPTSFYTLMATDVLNRAEPSCKLRPRWVALPGSTQPQPLPAAQPVDLRAALALYNHGLHSEARRVLRIVPWQYLSEADRVVAAYLYRRNGEIHRAALLTRSVVQQHEDPAVVNLAYPRPYDDLVNQASAEFGVPVALIYAIMREESAFNAQAVSPRQAVGLMQMIKPTAVRLARRAEIHHFTMRKLFAPQTAIRLGTCYLATLLREMDGDLPAAIAAYQAGERTVQHWRKRGSGLRTDEFIEDIPLTSTRGYVKKVLASYGVYRMLGGIPAEEAVHLAGDAMLQSEHAPRLALRP